VLGHASCPLVWRETVQVVRRFVAGAEDAPLGVLRLVEHLDDFRLEPTEVAIHADNDEPLSEALDVGGSREPL
jgi:hypothetical protein